MNGRIPATAKDLAALSAQAIREQARKLTEEIATRVQNGENEAKRIAGLGTHTGTAIVDAIEHFAKQTEGLMEYLRETEELCREASASISQMTGAPVPEPKALPPAANLDTLERDIVRGNSRRALHEEKPR